MFCLSHKANNTDDVNNPKLMQIITTLLTGKGCFPLQSVQEWKMKAVLEDSIGMNVEENHI